MSSLRKYLFFTVCMCSALAAFPQQKGKDLDSIQVTIVSPYKASLAEALKISDVPVIALEPAAPPKFGYPVSYRKINTSFEITPVKPVKIKDEKIPELYKSFLKLGMGTYTTPLAELYLNSLRSKTYSLAAKYTHLSSSGQLKNTGFSGYSKNGGGLSANRYFDKNILSAEADYLRNVVHYYGYTPPSAGAPEKGNIRQQFSDFSTSIGFGSTHNDKHKVRHHEKITGSFFSDAYKSSDNGILIDVSGGKYVHKEYYNLRGTFDAYTLQNAFSKEPRALITLTPSVKSWQNDSANAHWHLEAGMHMVAEADSSTRFHFYPTAHFSFNIAEEFLIMYAAIGGGVEKNSFRTLAEQNPFVNSVLAFRNTQNKLAVQGGLKGTLSTSTSFDAGVTYRDIRDAAFFINDPSDILHNKFIAAYDDVTLLNVHAEIGHYRTEKMRLNIHGDYFHYTMTNEARPWHIPNIKVTASITYNMGNKIYLKGDIFYIGTQYAKTYYLTGEQQLKDVTDINLGIDYRYTKLLSFFLQLNNAGAFKYYRWNQYPTQRFWLMGGLSYSFGSGI